MLLKRTEDNGIINALYESTNIVASSYEKTKNELKITFKSGVQYLYEDVAVVDYHKFELDESQGKIFNKYIKSHNFHKLGPVDLDSLRKSIEDAKREEIKSINESIITLCELVPSHFWETGEMNESHLRDLVRTIELRKTKLDKNE